MHPNGKGVAAIVKAILPKVEELIARPRRSAPPLRRAESTASCRASSPASKYPARRARRSRASTCRCRAARWTEPENLHLTLRFVGDIDKPQAAEFAERLAAIEVDAFELRLAGLGTFGGNEPRSIWAGVETAPELSRRWRARTTAPRAPPGLPPDGRPSSRTSRWRASSTRAPTRSRACCSRIGAFRSRPFLRLALRAVLRQAEDRRRTLRGRGGVPAARRRVRRLPGRRRPLVAINNAGRRRSREFAVGRRARAAGRPRSRRRVAVALPAAAGVGLSGVALTATHFRQRARLVLVALMPRGRFRRPRRGLARAALRPASCDRGTRWQLRVRAARSCRPSSRRCRR